MGEDLVLGGEVEDYSGKFALHLAGLTRADYRRFLPDGADFEELVQLVRFVLKDPLDFQLHLLPAEQVIKPMRGLEDDGSRLGWDLCLGEGSEAQSEEETVICVTDFTNF